MTVDVPSGRYAVEVENSGERMVLVEGKKVRSLGRSGVDPKRLTWCSGAQVLAAIAKDRVAAALRYSRLSGRCCICGRGLSAGESLARSIGPVCFERLSTRLTEAETDRFVAEFRSPAEPVGVAVG